MCFLHGVMSWSSPLLVCHGVVSFLVFLHEVVSFAQPLQNTRSCVLLRSTELCPNDAKSTELCLVQEHGVVSHDSPKITELCLFAELITELCLNHTSCLCCTDQPARLPAQYTVALSAQRMMSVTKTQLRALWSQKTQLCDKLRKKTQLCDFPERIRLQ